MLRSLDAIDPPFFWLDSSEREHAEWQKAETDWLASRELPPHILAFNQGDHPFPAQPEAASEPETETVPESIPDSRVWHRWPDVNPAHDGPWETYSNPRYHPRDNSGSYYLRHYRPDLNARHPWKSAEFFANSSVVWFRRPQP